MRLRMTQSLTTQWKRSMRSLKSGPLLRLKMLPQWRLPRTTSSLAIPAAPASSFRSQVLTGTQETSLSGSTEVITTTINTSTARISSTSTETRPGTTTSILPTFTATTVTQMLRQASGSSTERRVSSGRTITSGSTTRPTPTHANPPARR
ncbi:hypothetical protein FGO68_gene4589 [Halteria grandinella]|uniref:Uncharacterized protein n=1 Tax=Halteria grandinella TaxID=5974 RepID=A0A8J8T071_HALGN|nr:hypothetical protein FGO68_gene4589 [Halteria grandinella]